MEIYQALEAYLTHDAFSHLKIRLPAERESVPDAVSSDAVKKVVHEINTPLAIIKNYLHILADKLSHHGIAQDEIRIIQDEINRVSHLLGQLHPPSPTHTEPDELIDINDQIIDLFQIMEEPLKKHSNVTLTLDTENQLPAIRASKGSIKQVFVNLINNSVDAMPDGGDLTIQTRCARPSLNITHESVQESQAYLEIIVTDNGVGIPPEMKRRIFEPFITTKANNLSGLGLSIVRDIVTSLDGTIRCTSNKNQGTTFIISIPAQTPAHYPSEAHA